MTIPSQIQLPGTRSITIQVPGEGPKNCEVAIVGEAPGTHEALTGKPFVGVSGKMLDSLLATVGIQRHASYITNVIKEQPNANQISEFIDLSGRVAKPTPEYHAHHAILRDELAGCTANVIIALGGVALYALTGKKGITKWRGSILQATEEFGGRKVIPTIHPAAVLRNPVYKTMVAADLKKVAIQKASPLITLPKREYILAPTIDTALAFLKKMKEAKEVCFDIETSNNAVSCISFASSPDIGISIPFTSQMGEYYSLFDEMCLWREITSILEDPSITKVIQNANFDCTFLYHFMGIITRGIEDTMIAHNLLFPDFPKGLAFQTSWLTDEPFYKDDGAERHKGGFVDDLEYWKYNAKDALVTMECWKRLKDFLVLYRQEEFYRTQVDIIPSIMYMQERGIKVNTEDLKAFSLSLEQEVKNDTALLKEMAAKHGVADLNPNSPTQLKNYFYKTLGHKPYTVKGRVTTDVTALVRLARKGVEEARVIGNIRKNSKLLNTYATMNLDPDHRIRCFFDPSGTNTGRLSSRHTLWNTGGNMQNLAPAFKKRMLFDDGYIGFEADLSQAENRTVAWVADEFALKQAFIKGVDVHSLTYANMFGVKIEDVSKAPGSSYVGDGTKSQRYWGKQMNHSLGYNLGYRAFALRFELPEMQAKELVEGWHRIYPGVRGTFHLWVREQLRKSMTVVNCYGKQRRFFGQMGEVDQDAFAYVAQSTIAHKINRVLCQMWDQRSTTFEGLELLNQVHDSLVFQIPKEVGWERITELCLKVKELMEEPVPWKEPFIIPADFKMGTSFANMVELKTLKELERVYNEKEM